MNAKKFNAKIGLIGSIIFLSLMFFGQELLGLKVAPLLMLRLGHLHPSGNLSPKMVGLYRDAIVKAEAMEHRVGDELIGIFSQARDEFLRYGRNPENWLEDKMLFVTAPVREKINLELANFTPSAVTALARYATAISRADALANSSCRDAYFFFPQVSRQTTRTLWYEVILKRHKKAIDYCTEAQSALEQLRDPRGVLYNAYKAIESALFVAAGGSYYFALALEASVQLRIAIAEAQDNSYLQAQAHRESILQPFERRFLQALRIATPATDVACCVCTIAYDQDNPNQSFFLPFNCALPPNRNQKNQAQILLCHAVCQDCFKGMIATGRTLGCPYCRATLSPACQEKLHLL